MKRSQFEQLVREVIRETIRKVDGKYVVYPEKGGKRLGTHSSKKAAEKQLTAIHLNKEAVEIKYTNPNFNAEWEEAVRYPEFNNMGKESWIRTARVGQPVSYSSIKDVLGNVDLNFKDLKEPKKQRFQAAFQKGVIEMPIAVKFSDKDYDLVAGNTRLSGLVQNGIDPKIWIVDLSDMQENYADGKEKEIVDDILSGINEGSLDSVVSKMKNYAKKGLLTLAMVASVAQGLQAQNIPQNQVDKIQQTGVELVQQNQQINKKVEKENLKKVQKLLGSKFNELYKLAQQTGTILTANKGNNLSVLKNMNQMNAKAHYQGNIESMSLQDSKTFQLRDGNYIVVHFYQVNVNENYNDGKVNEQEMSQDDFNNVANTLRDSSKAKQIHSLLLQMFPQQKELLNYNYKNDSYAEFKRFIFFIDKYKLEGPVTINHTDLKLEPENMKDRERKYQDYITGKIDKYFRDTNADPRKVDLSKVPPITVDQNGFVTDGNHRAFLAIKQQKPLKGYKIVNANNTHPNVAKILQIVGREVKENYADGKVKGKSRPGRVKKAGASCKGSVTDLRAKAKKYGGEKGKMYHWCANMKGGKK